MEDLLLDKGRRYVFRVYRQLSPELNSHTSSLIDAVVASEGEAPGNVCNIYSDICLSRSLLL